MKIKQWIMINVLKRGDKRVQYPIQCIVLSERQNIGAAYFARAKQVVDKGKSFYVLENGAKAPVVETKYAFKLMTGGDLLILTPVHRNLLTVLNIDKEKLKPFTEGTREFVAREIEEANAYGKKPSVWEKIAMLAPYIAIFASIIIFVLAWKATSDDIIVGKQIITTIGNQLNVITDKLLLVAETLKDVNITIIKKVGPPEVE